MSATGTATTASALRPRLSRRTVIRAGLGGALLWPLHHHQVNARVPGMNHPSHIHIHTWLLGSASELRPVPLSQPSQAEIDELLGYQTDGPGANNAAVINWSTGPTVLPWTDITLDLIRKLRPSPPRAARALALVHAAIADTVTAVEDACRAAGPGAPAVPSEQAAVAGAAATALSAAFPRAAKLLAGLEREAAEATLWAGAGYRGEIEAGLSLGRPVGGLAAAWAAADGADQVWEGTPPTGPGAWQPTPPKYRAEPLEPLAGTWRTWVLPNGAAYRPAPPPTWGSAAMRAELAAVQMAVARRTPEQSAAVHYWAGGPGTVTPAGLWVELARNLILRDQLDSPSAARALALTTIAMHDAFVCCWDAKYAYWLARPITADPTLNVLIPTPPFPTYTSGHSTISAAAATVLGELFPADAADLAAMAREAKDSRLWAGIHFPIDNEIGATGGALVGRLVLAAGDPARSVRGAMRSDS